MKMIGFVLLTLFSTASLAALKPFALPQMNIRGQNYDTNDHPAGIFVIEAYFLNCPYCNQNASNVNSLASKYAQNPRVQVLDVGVDREDSKYDEWISRNNPNHPVLKDARQQVISQLGTSSYPSTYVISCAGSIIYQHEGVWSSQAKRDIERAIDSLNEEDCPL